MSVIKHNYQPPIQNNSFSGLLFQWVAQLSFLGVVVRVRACDISNSHLTFNANCDTLCLFSNKRLCGWVYHCYFSDPCSKRGNDAQVKMSWFIEWVTGRSVHCGPVCTRHWPNTTLVLGRSLRRRLSIETILGGCFVLSSGSMPPGEFVFHLRSDVPILSRRPHTRWLTL